jgi:hypothetical protein
MNLELLQEAYQNDAAVAFIWTIVEVVSIGADLRAKADLPESRIDALLINAICAVPSNQFFQQFAPQLLPVMHQTLMRIATGFPVKPACSDIAEYTTYLCGGPERAKEYAPQIRSMFNEHA